MTLPLLTFFTIDSGMIEAMIGYVGDIFTDFSPILLIIVGVSLGLMVISVVINALRK
jgi:hypothetical protein